MSARRAGSKVESLLGLTPIPVIERQIPCSKKQYYAYKPLNWLDKFSCKGR